MEVKNLKVSDFEFSYVEAGNKEVCDQITKFIRKHEWLGKMPMRPTHRFIATYKGIIAGVVVMATPNAFSNLLGFENRNLEKQISRGACISWSPKNLGSSLIMYGVRWMVKNTQFRFFTAFSDIEAKELGTIYQACNFTYLGQCSGAKKEYFDPKWPGKGWFSDRQFRKTSQLRRYAKEAGINWYREYIKHDRIQWDKMTDIEVAEIKYVQEQHIARCLVRAVPPKHKYVYILGQNTNETLKLKKLFRKLHPELQHIPYPKIRGAVIDTAGKVIEKKENILTKNPETDRPQDKLLRFQLPDKQFLSIKEVATFMNVSSWSVYHLIKFDPKFPAINIGIKKKYVVDRNRLELWIYDRSQHGESK